MLLLALAGMIGKLLATGQMAKYMATWLDPLSAAAAALLAVMGAFELATLLDRRARSLRLESDRSEHAGVCPDQVATAPEAPRKATPTGAEEALTALLVALVVGIGLFVTPRALGSSGLGGEPVSGLLLRYAPGHGASGGVPPMPSSTAPLIGDFDGLLNALRRAGAAMDGQRVRVAGTIVPADDLGPGELTLLRYQIAHCVADARPLALLVVAPRGATPEALEADRWIEVEGTLAERQRGGDRLVTIEATRISPIEEPASPYLSPPP